MNDKNDILIYQWLFYKYVLSGPWGLLLAC